jgi:hypothetical protein
MVNLPLIGLKITWKFSLGLYEIPIPVLIYAGAKNLEILSSKFGLGVFT